MRSTWPRLKLGIVIFASIFIGNITSVLGNGSQGPNIVLILADDLGWSDLGCYGHSYHRTPNLDQLANEGMRFTNGYAGAPICSASRASLLTGQAVPRVGFEFVTKNDPGHQKLNAAVPLQSPAYTLNLPLKEVTIAERLNSLGYQTAFFGKWHLNQHYQRRYLAWHPEYGPEQQGFLFTREDFGDHPYAWKNKKQSDLPDGEFPKDSLINGIADFIKRDHEQPFFAMASLYYVHTPIKNRTRWLLEEYEERIPHNSPNRRKRLEYAAFVETLDHHLGTILQAINDAGKVDNTLVVFTSDNGAHPEFSANGPLRGSKWNLYEGGIRVPYIARWPGKVAAGTVSNVPVIGYDLHPTFTKIAGGEANQVDGIDLTPIFEEKECSTDRNLIWHFPYYHPESSFAEAIDDIGVNDFAVSKTRPQSAIRAGRYKLLKFAEDGRCELYDLQEDLSEQNDLSSDLPEKTRELEEKLEQQLTEMNARRAQPIGLKKNE